MWKWNIDILLKGSGNIVRCMYEGPEEDTRSVIVKLFQGKGPNEWVDLLGDDTKHHKFIVVSEIAYVDIYERKR